MRFKRGKFKDISIKMKAPVEFLISISLMMGLGLIALCLEFVAPFQGFVIHKEDSWLYSHHHYQHSTVSVPKLSTITVLPAATVAFVNFKARRKSADVKAAFLGLASTVSLNLFITNLIKIAVGRPRPDFLQRCWPGNNGRTEAAFDLDKDGLQHLRCTGADDVITEGRKSFPSGHSSLAFSIAGFTVIYLAGKFGFGALNVITCALIGCVPTLIAVSRVRDYRHHWQDVLVGSMLGLLCAYLSYRAYYPSLCSASAGEPKSEAAAAIVCSEHRKKKSSSCSLPKNGGGPNGSASSTSVQLRPLLQV